jgi:hypothetical protein
MSNQSNQCVKPDYQNKGFQPGNDAWKGRLSPQQRYIRKLQTAMDMAIDGLGDRLGTDGASACAKMITDALEKDFVGTLSKLQFFMPKNINVDVQITKDNNELSDDELVQLINERRAIAQAKQGVLIDQSSQVVEIDTHTIECVEIVDSQSTVSKTSD